MGDCRDKIKDGAEEIRRLCARIKLEFERQPHGKKHEQACEEYHAHHDGLAFPGGWKLGLEALKQGDKRIAEIAIQFLELDEFFFRSGYMKEDLLRHLKHVKLAPAQRKRLTACARRSLHHGGRRETTLYARLIASFGDPVSLERAEGWKERAQNPESRRRLHYLIDLLKQKEIP